MCDALEVSRAGYYAWQRHSESAREQRDRELMPFIHHIFWQHKRRYGARRIAVELQAQGRPYLAYYNHDRRHSSLNYLTPAAFEAQLNRSI